MKKYLVIGNPIQHSLSPKLHNYWIKNNNIDAIYDKKKVDQNGLKDLIKQIGDDKINGANVTVPYKKEIIPFLDELTATATETQSVNIIYKKNKKIIGDNTDVEGFMKSLHHINYDIKNKNAFILGAGGVAPSIIIALKRMGASKIILSNRSKEKAENIKKKYPFLELIDWGNSKAFDIIINATSLGLNENDEIKLDYETIEKNKLFYDVIYNPRQTKFLKKGKELGNQTENGTIMFAYQAQLSFKIWHNIKPAVNDKVIQLLEND